MNTARLLSILLVLIAIGAAEALANSLAPVAVVNFYPERAPLSSSNHGRMITGEEVTFDGRASYTTRSGTVITTYRWFVNGSQTQSGTSPVFTYTAGAAGTNVTIGLEVRDSYGTWSTRRNVVMEVAPIPRRYYYITDHLGSVRAVTNELGQLIAYSDFYPFGLEMPKRSLAGDDATKEGYTGHELDAETGLNYAGARYYDPEIGRWLAVDPHARNYPGWSPYHYAGNSPVLIYDPDGKDWSIVKEVDEDGNITYKIHVRMAIYNSSDSKLDMEALRDATVQQIVDAFSFNQCSDVCTTAVTTVDARVVSGMRDVEPHEHLLEVTNSLPANAAGMAPFGGMRMYITPDVAESAISGSNVRTIAHELGHTGRLHHPNSPNAPLEQQMSTAAGVNNVMFQAVTAGQMGFPASQTTTINSRQAHALHNYYTGGRLNRNNNFVFPSVLGPSIPRQPGIFPWIRR
jgi:RHS repeat-associated protein